MLEQQSAYEHDKKERELLQKQLQQQRLLFSENIEQLRAALQPDEPCMVCGSQQHPYREQQHLLEKSLLVIQEQQEKIICKRTGGSKSVAGCPAAVSKTGNRPVTFAATATALS